MRNLTTLQLSLYRVSD